MQTVFFTKQYRRITSMPRLWINHGWLLIFRPGYIILCLYIWNRIITWWDSMYTYWWNCIFLIHLPTELCQYYINKNLSSNSKMEWRFLDFKFNHKWFFNSIEHHGSVKSRPNRYDLSIIILNRNTHKTRKQSKLLSYWINNYDLTWS